MSQRIIFTFDDNSIESLDKVKNNGGFTSLATAVRDSVQINEVLQQQVTEGFTEIVVRNPKTKKEKTLVIPSLQKVKSSGSAENR